MIETDTLPCNTVLKCEQIAVCYRKPRKLGQSSRVENREFWPFEGLDLELKRGETIGVTGNNGAGKSTLLRLISGVIAPDRGTFMKKPGLRVQLLSINLGFEKILTGRENALMAGILLGKTRQEMSEKIDSIHDFSELGSFFDEPVYAYSSGMLARLGFSIAVEADPDVLLLDEILNVGDRSFRLKSRAKTVELMKSGKSVVLVSHDPKTLKDFTDRTIRIGA